MSFLGAMAGIAAAGGSALQSTGLLSYGTSKRMVRYQRKQQQKYDKVKAALDYDYAQRYGENSAKWSVRGLKNAGLNPILAATDGNMGMTYGNGSTGSVGGASGGGSGDLGSSLSHAAKASIEYDQAQANLDLLKSEQKLKDEQARKAGIEADNAARTRGHTGVAGVVSDIMTTAAHNSGKMLDKANSVAKAVRDIRAPVSSAKDSSHFQQAVESALKAVKEVQSRPVNNDDDEKRKKEVLRQRQREFENARRDRNRQRIYERNNFWRLHDPDFY